MDSKNVALGAFVVLTLIFASIAAVEYSRGPSLSTTEKTTTTSTVVETRISNTTITSTTTSIVTSTYVSPQALQLHVILNATTVRSGGAIRANIRVFNPLDVNVSITPNYQHDSQGNSSILFWNGREFLCGGSPVSNPTLSLAGYALFQGRYTSANLSAGIPLQLSPPLDFSCAASPYPSQIVILPRSTSIVAYFSQSGQRVVSLQATMNAATNVCAQSPGDGYGCEGSTSLFGYWSQPAQPFEGGQDAPITSPYFHYFAPGVYTLVVEGMWGEVSYSYIQVTP